MKFIIRLIPYPLRRYLKRILLTKQDKKIKNYIENNNIKNAILLSGFKKSGNTWARFIIFNYLNILNNSTNKSLTFDDLNAIQSHALELGSVEPFKSGFPAFYRTHSPYKEIFNLFSKVIYIYRNPLDTLISLYYYEKNRAVPFGSIPNSKRKKLNDIDYFVLSNIHKWIYHYKSTISKSNAIIRYEKMKEDAYSEFAKLLKQLDFEFREDALKKSIHMSSTENIKKMGRETNQIYGMAKPNSFRGEFIRSGKVGQYLSELKPETIEKVKRILFKNKIYIEM